MSAFDPFPCSVTVGYLEVKTIETFPQKSRMPTCIALHGTTLLCLRETHDIQSTITQIIALSE